MLDRKKASDAVTEQAEPDATIFFWTVSKLHQCIKLVHRVRDSRQLRLVEGSLDMSLNADEIVRAIGEGVREALEMNRFFLGLERQEMENADIHPEYVTTVKVAEKFAGADREVSLETHMKTLRIHALNLARLKHRESQSWSGIEKTLRSYAFGKKDSQRIDIVVRPSERSRPPLLLIEAKLGTLNSSGVLNDISRVVKLLSMYRDADLGERHAIYGAVVFHHMTEEDDTASLKVYRANFLNVINADLKNQKLAKSWLRSKADFLHSAAETRPISGYQEYHDDGSVEDIFAKAGFTFAPGLILLGSAADIEAVTF